WSEAQVSCAIVQTSSRRTRRDSPHPPPERLPRLQRRRTRLARSRVGEEQNEPGADGGHRAERQADGHSLRAVDRAGELVVVALRLWIGLAGEVVVGGAPLLITIGIPEQMAERRGAEQQAGTAHHVA